jgi:hypothetical protein
MALENVAQRMEAMFPGRPGSRSRWSTATIWSDWSFPTQGGSHENPARRRRGPGRARLRRLIEELTTVRGRRRGSQRRDRGERRIADRCRSGPARRADARHAAAWRWPRAGRAGAAAGGDPGDRLPEYALDAFERNVADYLVKPVRRERLQEALERVPLTTRPQRAVRHQRPATRIASAPERALPRRRADRADRRGHVPAGRAKIRHRPPPGGTHAHRRVAEGPGAGVPDRFMRIHRNALVATDCWSAWRRAPTAAASPCSPAARSACR